jgi:hypothetical protein
VSERALTVNFNGPTPRLGVSASKIRKSGIKRFFRAAC